MAIRAYKGNQGLGKWESAATMVRLVRELADRLEELEGITSEELGQVNDIVLAFKATLPAKVCADLFHG